MQTRLVSPVLAVVLAATALPLGAQVPAGPEFQVNTVTAGEQAFSSVATNDAGDFLVGWFCDPPFFDLFGQSFSPSGAPRGSEFAIPEVTSYFQDSVALASTSRGRFIAVWHSADGVSADRVAGRVFDPSGPLTGEFDVAPPMAASGNAPKVAAQPGREFVVVWYGPLDGSAQGIVGQRMRDDGTAIGVPFQVNTFTLGEQLRPAIASAADGSFVVVWAGDLQDGSGYGVFGRRFDRSGVPVGNEFQVNVYTTGRQEFSAVASDAAGNFLVAWTDESQDGSASGVYARAYSASGVPGSEFRVNVSTTGYQRIPAVAADANGNFVIAWGHSTPGGSDFEVVGRRLRSGALGPEFRVNSYTTGIQFIPAIDSDDVGNLVVTWTSFDQDGSNVGVFGQRFGGLLPVALAVDPAPTGSSDGNRVLEGGETVLVAPTWRNVNGAAQTFSGVAPAFTGPGAPGDPAYTIVDGVASYGTVPDGGSASCSDCYSVGLSVPTARPAAHWDAAFREDILPVAQGQSKSWILHVGDSFSDVPRASGFYRFVETLVHHDATGGCAAGLYCPAGATTREQMAVLVLVAAEGSGYQPRACAAPAFADVPASSPFCRWVEELARRGVVGGCGGGNYCPTAPVTREQMAIFVLRTLDPALVPAPCAAPNVYGDVPETSAFCPWIEELTARGVVTGCGGGNYCPAAPVTREQTAVFVSLTFGLALYGP